MLGGTPKVGGHSEASSTPSLPEVPAPMYTSLPSLLNARTTSSTSAAMLGKAFSTAKGTPLSSSLIILKISITGRSSICSECTLRDSVVARSRYSSTESISMDKLLLLKLFFTFLREMQAHSSKNRKIISNYD